MRNLRGNLRGRTHDLDGLILSALVGPPSHGYAVTARLRSQAGDGFDIPEGTVYPALHRLERVGLVTSGWADIGGRRRRVYQLTGAGAAAVERQSAPAWRPSRVGHLLAGWCA